MITIPIDKLVAPVEMARRFTHQQGLDELAASIRLAGIIHPLVVRKVGSEYEIVCGHRRYLAAKVVGLVEVPCIVIDGDDTRTNFVKLHENLHRLDMNVMEEAYFFERMKVSGGMSSEQIARSIGRSHDYVDDRLALLKYPADIQKELASNSVTISQAKELARIKDRRVMMTMMDVVKNKGMTVATLSKWVQDYHNTVDQTHVVEGATLPPIPDTSPHVVMSKCTVCTQLVDVVSSNLISVCNQCLTALRDVQGVADVQSVG